VLPQEEATETVEENDNEINTETTDELKAENMEA
jgi:hypothetical protein